MALSHLMLIITWLAFCSPQEKPGYPEIFGSDYEYAVKTIENRSWWSDSLNTHGIDPHFALSIVFPELIRYSSISDYIEVKGLEVLYVQYGRDYADFSIGLFQMKPSFAEKIESDLLQYRLTDKFPSLSSLNPGNADDLDTRKARIIRLKDEYHQLLYLEAFIRIMDFLYVGIADNSPGDKLVFYSAAYNTGYLKDEKVIREEMEKSRFYCGTVEPEQKHSYAGIAVNYYLYTKPQSR